MRGMATLPQCWKTPGELGVSKSMDCDISLQCLTLLVGWQEGHPTCKNWMLVCWWWFDWSFARLIAPVVYLPLPPPSSFASINTGYPRLTWKWPLNRRERERETAKLVTIKHRFLWYKWLLSSVYNETSYDENSNIFWTASSPPCCEWNGGTCSLTWRFTPESN